MVLLVVFINRGQRYIVWRLERECVSVHADNLESAGLFFSVENLDQAIPARTCKEWKAEIEDAGNSAGRPSTFLCAICFRTLQERDMVRHLPCGHVFHSNCLTKWFLKQHDTCPICRHCYMPHTQPAA
ncbi:hypothetical protein IWW34DRAFT_637143 [Fusarium oxysporum f. sp. albedinis]|nr:hypothetical protein IWW34DRAFT_637143 [Fusarium oxysporum f. sp. albedinis]